MNQRRSREVLGFVVEDIGESQLMELVTVYGPQNWNHIAEKMQGRTGKKTSILV